MFFLRLSLRKKREKTSFSERQSHSALSGGKPQFVTLAQILSRLSTLRKV
jgi:hypothetical protein